MIFNYKSETEPFAVSLLIAETTFKYMKRQREILMPHGTKIKLKESTGYSEVTIRFALKGLLETDASKLIRKRAMEMGGVLAK